jgi:hypothetical protein
MTLAVDNSRLWQCCDPAAIPIQRDKAHCSSLKLLGFPPPLHFPSSPLQSSYSVHINYSSHGHLMTSAIHNRFGPFDKSQWGMTGIEECSPRKTPSPLCFTPFRGMSVETYRMKSFHSPVWIAKWLASVHTNYRYESVCTYANVQHIIAYRRTKCHCL